MPIVSLMWRDAHLLGDLVRFREKCHIYLCSVLCLHSIVMCC